MTRLRLVCLALLAPATAWAQTPGPMPGGTTGEEEEEKGDGVAEAAPRAPGLLPTTPTLPPPKGKRNRFELFELDGYFRLRGDYFKNFNLSFRDDPDHGGAPFPQPHGCQRPSEDGFETGRPCEDSVKSTNIRLRLEPRINVNENTSVHAQIDVLDNYVFGSDPVVDEQMPPRPAVDPGTGDELRVKRAWAEVVTPLGILKFGRMPVHWGLGIYENAGGEDPINGGYDYDSDYGDTRDRLSFATLIPGTRLRAGLAMDWPRTYPVSSQTTGTAARTPQPWDLDDNDDTTQWVLTIAKMDKPDDFKDAVERGALGVNGGAYFVYRTQGWDYTGTASDEELDPDRFVPRDSTLYLMDLWGRIGWRKLLFEGELVASTGRIEQVSDLGLVEPVTVRQYGGVGRLTARALDDKLRFGFETGFASGDDWDNVEEGRTHISNAQFGNPDSDARPTRLSRFVFDRDYEVDLILFRELLGAVSNAGYAKPFMSYDLTKSIMLRIANVTSFALQPVATPGNATMYGTEFDIDVGYRSSSFDAGLAYGILFPLSAMNHPADGNGGVVGGSGGFEYDDGATTVGEANIGDAGNAHTLQMRLVVKF